MIFIIRKINQSDKERYLKLVAEFYSSDAVFHNVPQKHFEDTFQELMRSDDYCSCYMIEYEGETAGYALLAKTFSQEAGGMVLWIDELYVIPEFRGHGLGHEFFKFIKKHMVHDIKRVRLEVEDSNLRAKLLYNRLGFNDLPYSQMIRDL